MSINKKTLKKYKNDAFIDIGMKSEEAGYKSSVIVFRYVSWQIRQKKIVVPQKNLKEK